jgi:hypothetical protein
MAPWPSSFLYVAPYEQRINPKSVHRTVHRATHGPNTAPNTVRNAVRTPYEHRTRGTERPPLKLCGWYDLYGVVEIMRLVLRGCVNALPGIWQTRVRFTYPRGSRRKGCKFTSRVIHARFTCGIRAVTIRFIWCSLVVLSRVWRVLLRPSLSFLSSLHERLNLAAVLTAVGARVSLCV